MLSLKVDTSVCIAYEVVKLIVPLASLILKQPHQAIAYSISQQKQNA